MQSLFRVGLSVITLVVLVCVPVLGDQLPRQAKLYVHVQGLRNHSGITGALLFQSSAGFPDTKARAYRMNGARINNGRSVIVFEDLPPGTYALSVIHDENENRMMDKNLLRMPAEGFGFSNNPQTGLSLPEFEQSSFLFNGENDVHIYVRIRYI